MAAATTTMLVAGGISAAASAAQAIKGAKEAKEARQELERLQVPQLSNAYEGMRVSTLGADLQKEQNALMTAGSVDALRSSGVRGIIGGLGQVADRQQTLDYQVAADLDRQQQQIEQLQAQDRATLRGMTEQRYYNDLNALSSQVNAGRASVAQGIGGIGKGIVSGLQGYVNQQNFENYLRGNFGFDPVTGKRS